MIKDLNILYEELKEIRTYLIKIGSSRRHGNVLTRKLTESKEIFARYTSLVDRLSIEIRKGKIGNDEVVLINQFCLKFNSLYKELLTLCDSSSIQEIKSKFTNMDFELKTALSLLPIMTDELHITRQLIDAIEYYESILNTASKPLLVNFVLKSRLSQAAKLRLSPSYDAVKNLVEDMKKMLLPQKSATALQNQLINIKQNEMSLSDYGSKVAELFTELTISQSEGNSDNYQVLKPLNEKLAIKRFADGLRNRKLNTIISARNFSNLKDAIQAAIDEDTSAPSTSQDTMMTMRYPNKYYRSNNRYFRGQFTRGRFNRGMTYQGWQRGGCTQQRGGYSQPNSGNQRFRGRGRGFAAQGQRSANMSRQTPGTSYYNRGNFRAGNRQIRVATETDNQESENVFFRD